MDSTDKKLTLQSGTLLPLYSVSGHREYKARFVKAGRVRASGNRPSRIVVDAKALEQAAANNMFDDKAVFVDHAGWFEYPSLDRLVGVTFDASYNYEDQSIEGIIRIHNTQSGRLAAELIDELLNNEEHQPDVGLSIVFYPTWQYEEGSEDKHIVAFNHVESVDLVFEPAADGRILQALSTRFTPHILQSAPDLDPNTPYIWHCTNDDNSCQSCKDRHGQTRTGSEWLALGIYPKSDQLECDGDCRCELIPQQGELTMSDQPITTQLSNQSPPPAPPNVEAWVAAAAQASARAMLNASDLPEASRQRLIEHFDAHPASDPQDVQDAIEAERAYLARLAEDNVIQIGGQPPRAAHISGMLTSLDRIQVALEAMLEGKRPEGNVQPLTGIRELYHLLSGDYEMTGVFQADRIQFANVTSSTMANIVANALNKRVMNEFQQYPMWWEPIVLAEDFQTLQTVKWITLGGVGELPTVDEGAAYTELTWDDGAETGTFVKKGGYLGLTIEAIDKDDTGRIKAAPRALAQAAWLTLAKAISAIFTANSGVGPTMSDAVALFHASHSNLGSTALSITSWNAARLAMRKQAELNSDERLGALTAPKFLLVPPDLEVTALQVLASEYDYTYALSNGVVAPVNVNVEGNDLQARMNFARSRVVVIDLWTDTNNWAAICDPRLYPTIGLAFRYGRVPEIFSVASPTAGLMFSNDTMPIKIRFFFATGPIDYRGLYKANV